MSTQVRRRDGKRIPVLWVFQPKPPAPKMRTFKNGQSIKADVQHGPHAETDGGRQIIEVYCYGCGEYFRTYHHYLWRHGLCKERPKR